MSKPLKIVFAGTPDISAQVLTDLLKTHHQVVAVYTQPDRPSGRGKKVLPTPVKAVALEQDIPVYQPLSFKKEPQALEVLKSLQADVMVVIAYGLLLPQAVLDAPQHGCLNIHVSLLPQWRGAAPIQRAIQAGDTQTGITIMQMDAGLDTGDILAQHPIEISLQDTAQTLHDKISEHSSSVLNNVLDNLEYAQSQAIKQQGEATYAHKISKEEGRIDWCQSAKKIDCHIRAFTPWPSAYFTLNGQNIKIGTHQILSSQTDAKAGTVIAVSKEGFDVQTQDQLIRITSMQLAGKKMLSIKDILNGNDLSQFIGINLNTQG